MLRVLYRVIPFTAAGGCFPFADSPFLIAVIVSASTPVSFYSSSHPRFILRCVPPCWFLSKTYLQVTEPILKVFYTGFSPPQAGPFVSDSTDLIAEMNSLKSLLIAGPICLQLCFECRFHYGIHLTLPSSHAALSSLTSSGFIPGRRRRLFKGPFLQASILQIRELIFLKLKASGSGNIGWLCHFPFRAQPRGSGPPAGAAPPALLQTCLEAFAGHAWFGAIRSYSNN